MQISVMSIAYRDFYQEGKIDITDFIRYCKKIGVDGVEITQDDEQGKELAVEKVLEETGLKVSSYNFSVRLPWPIDSLNKEVLQHFKKSMQRAKRLGAKVVMFTPAIKFSKEFLPEDRRKELIKTYSEFVRCSPDNEIALAFENAARNRKDELGKISHVKELLEGIHSPYFRLIFDTGNFVMAEEDPQKAFMELLPYIAHVHLKDVVKDSNAQGGYKDVPIGEGIVDFLKIFRILKDSNYKGFLSIECAGTGDKNIKDNMMAVSVKNTKNLLGKVLS